MKRLTIAALLATAMLFGACGASLASETHVVEMLNKDPDNKKRRNIFKPDIVYAKPGDKIVFKSVDKNHNSESMKKMLPEGAQKWKSKLSRDFELTVTVPGVYGYRCTPHYALGMVGLIVVAGEGLDASLVKAKSVKQRGNAKKVFEDIFSRVKLPAGN